MNKNIRNIDINIYQDNFQHCLLLHKQPTGSTVAGSGLNDSNMIKKLFIYILSIITIKGDIKNT